MLSVMRKAYETIDYFYVKLEIFWVDLISFFDLIHELGVIDVVIMSLCFLYSIFHFH